jgi:hypothetical protein
METFFREMINNIYASPEKFQSLGAPASLPASAENDQHAGRDAGAPTPAVRRLRAFVARLFPTGGRSAAEQKALAEESIKTVFIMQFMDGWTFDTERLSKCSCQHLLPGNRRVPSCGYYAYHRRRDARFA